MHSLSIGYVFTSCNQESGPEVAPNLPKWWWKQILRVELFEDPISQRERSRHSFELGSRSKFFNQSHHGHRFMDFLKRVTRIR